MSDESKSLLKYLLLVTLLVVLVSVCIISYSITGYTLRKYPGVVGEMLICVEGEVNPTNQTITVENAGDSPTEYPYVSINGMRHEFSLAVSDAPVRMKTEALRLGCNEVSFGAQTDTPFKVKVEYLSHWRPVVSYLEIGNLMAGHTSRYFVSTADSSRRAVVKSRLNITDVSKDLEGVPKFYAEFNGSAVRYQIDLPGNYKADVQAFDGYVWSDVYEVAYTAHVIQTEEQKRAYRVYEIEDDPIREYGGYVPVAVKPGDNEAVKFGKRAVDGGYMLLRWAGDWVRYKTSG